jgi:hypothetical protein
MDFLKKFAVSTKEVEGGVKMGKKWFSDKEPLTEGDVEDVVKYALSSDLPIFTNVQLKYIPTDFYSTGKDDHSIKEDYDDASKLMLMLSNLATKSGERMFNLSSGDYPSITLQRPFQIANSVLLTKDKREVETVAPVEPKLGAKVETPAPVETKEEVKEVKEEAIAPVETKEEVKEVKEEVVAPVEPKLDAKVETPAPVETKEEVKEEVIAPVEKKEEVVTPKTVKPTTTVKK